MAAIRRSSPPMTLGRWGSHWPWTGHSSRRSPALPGEQRRFWLTRVLNEVVELAHVAPHHVGVVVRSHLKQQLPFRGGRLDIRIAPLEGPALESPPQLLGLEFHRVLLRARMA